MHSLEMVWCTSFVRKGLLLMIGVISLRKMLLQCVVIEFLWLIIGRERLASALPPRVYIWMSDSGIQLSDSANQLSE